MKQSSLMTFTIIILTLTASTVYIQKPLVAHAQTSNTNPLLTVTGLVSNPLSLSLSDIRAMPQTTEDAALYCVDDPGTPLQSGAWTGVSLSYLLQLANVSTSAIKVAFFAPDGYSADLTVQMAMQNDILLAYEKDNASLSGLQLVVPGNWGYKWITNPNEIQLVNYNFLGTTESEGYSDDATTSISGATIPGNPQPSFYLPQNATLTPSQSSTATSPPTPSPAPTPTSSAAVVTSNPRTKPTPTVSDLVATAVVIIAISLATSAIILTAIKKTRSPNRAC